MTVVAGRWRMGAVTVVMLVAAGGCKDRPGPTMQVGPPTTLSGVAAGRALTTVAAGKLTACTSVPDPPFTLEEDGELDGIDIKLVLAVAARLALQPTFEQVAAGDIFEALAAGRCDLAASSLTITAERMQTFDFSAPYFRVDQSLLVRKADERRYPDLASLAGGMVGVQASSAGAAYAAANAGGAIVTEYRSADDLLNALTGGQVDGALQDLSVNAFDATSTGETVVVETFPDAEKEHYGFALKKGNTVLRTAFDAALAQVRSDDTYPSILRQFLGTTAGQV